MQQRSYDGWGLIRRWDSFLVATDRVNENTRRQYKRALAQFLMDPLICKCPTQVTEDDIVEWIRDKRENGSKAEGPVLRALHSFYGWAWIREEITPNPVRAFPVPKTKRTVKRVMRDEDLAKVIRAARAYQDPRLAPALEFMYATGCRIGSLCGVRAEDLDFDRHWVEFTKAKNDDPYGVPMNDRAIAAAKELLALADYTPKRGKRRDTLVGVGPTNVMRWIQDVEDVAGVRFHSHRLRHKIITELIRDPLVPPAAVSRFANHKDLKTTMEYVDALEDEMRSAVQGR